MDVIPLGDEAIDSRSYSASPPSAADRPPRRPPSWTGPRPGIDHIQSRTLEIVSTSSSRFRIVILAIGRASSWCGTCGERYRVIAVQPRASRPSGPGESSCQARTSV